MKSCITDSAIKQWFRSANCDGGYGVALLTAIAVLAALALGGPALRGALQYQRNALAAGQWWRLLTAHLVHLNGEHAALNIVGLSLLWSLFAREFKPSQWLVILLLAAAMIDAGLWWFAPAVQWYVGASGVLHAIWSAGAYAALMRRERFGVMLIALLIVKLAYEQTHGTSAIVAGLPVVVDAHWYGALAGLLAARALGAGVLGARRKSL